MWSGCCGNPRISGAGTGLRRDTATRSRKPGTRSKLVSWREKAQQINEELKKQNLAPDAARQFLLEQNLGTVFQLDKVSQLTAPEFNLPGMKFSATDYRRYTPPREFLPYPPADFVQQLLKLKKRGDSLVIADKPAKHFYVAVLMEDPQPPQRREFYDVYNQPLLDNRDFMAPKQEEPLWSKMMADRQRKYAQKCWSKCEPMRRRISRTASTSCRTAFATVANPAATPGNNPGERRGFSPPHRPPG